MSSPPISKAREAVAGGLPRHLGLARRHPLFANSFFLWSSAGIGALSGFAFWTLAARWYGSSEIGLASAGLAGWSLLAMLTHLGLGIGIVRFLPDEAGREARLINTCLVLTVGAAAAASIVFLGGLGIWAPDLAYLRARPLESLAFVLFVVAGAASVIQDKACLAARDASYIATKTALVQLLRVVLLVAFSAIAGAFSIVAAAGFASVFGFLVGFAFLRRALPSYRPSVTVDRRLVARLLPYSIGSYGAEFIALAPNLVLPIMVVRLAGAEQAAYFYVSWFTGQLLLSISLQVAFALFVEGARDQEGLLVLSRDAIALCVGLVGVGCLILVLFGSEILNVFGAEYSRASTRLLALVAIAAIPAALNNLCLAAQRVRKDMAGMFRLSVLIATATIGISYLAIQRLGLEGAGYGLLAGHGLGALAAARWFQTRVSERSAALKAAFEME